MKKNTHSLSEVLPHRIQQAERSLESAGMLLDIDRTAAVNRLYYAAFYALTALALLHGYETSKHLQLIGWFNKEWINSGKLEKEYGRIVRELFEKRQESDYEVFVHYEQAEIEALISPVSKFVTKVKTIISETPLTS